MMDAKQNISQTAMLIASLRALACYEEDPNIKGNDYLAECFLPDDKKLPLKNTEFRDMIKKAIPEGLYEYVIARTKYFDDLFIQSLNSQISQIVLLGAGYDSRAYRFKNQLGNTAIYEVDTPNTQAEKCRLFKENNIHIPKNVIYISNDFETDDMFEKLYSKGFDNSALTLFIWEGVTFYLNSSTIYSTLKTIAQKSASGSILSFDYQHIDDKANLIDTRLKGEQIKFGINTDECKQLLIKSGYRVLETVDSQLMCNRYLTMASGETFGTVKSIMHFIKAEII